MVEQIMAFNPVLIGMASVFAVSIALLFLKDGYIILAKWKRVMRFINSRCKLGWDLYVLNMNRQKIAEDAELQSKVSQLKLEH